MEWKELPSRIYGKGVAIKEGAGHQGWSPGVKEHRGEENGLTGRLTEGLSRGGGCPLCPQIPIPTPVPRLAASHMLSLGTHPKLEGSLQLIKKLNELSEEN